MQYTQWRNEGPCRPCCVGGGAKFYGVQNHRSNVGQFGKA